MSNKTELRKIGENLQDFAEKDLLDLYFILQRHLSKKVGDQYSFLVRVEDLEAILTVCSLRTQIHRRQWLSKPVFCSADGDSIEYEHLSKMSHLEKEIFLHLSEIVEKLNRGDQLIEIDTALLAI